MKFEEMKIAYYNYLVMIVLLLANTTYAQSNIASKKASFPSIIDTRASDQDLLKTSGNLFLAKIYTIDKVVAGKHQHWFLKITDQSNKPLNFAKIQLQGYLKNDRSINFSYNSQIVPLGNDGKYIIKSVEIPRAGTWIFEATINNTNQIDTFLFETKVY
ncbi:MAG: hypothetical protein AAF847_06945 [Bacteroidota bacterium]